MQVYLSLLHMYLSPPDAHCLGPIKMELSEPQANLQAALQVLELHHNKLNTTKVRISLANTTGSCSSQVLVLTSPHEMVREHVSNAYFNFVALQLIILPHDLSMSFQCSKNFAFWHFTSYCDQPVYWHFQTASHTVS